MQDPIDSISGEGLIEMAQRLSLQLEKRAETKPMLFLIAESRKKAKVALFALVHVDPNRTDEIQRLQNEVTLYSDMIESCQLLFKTAREQARMIDEHDRENILDLVHDPEIARELGVEPPPED